MKTRSLLFIGTAVVLMSVLFACKKDNKGSDSGQSPTELQTQSDDQTRVSNETDAVADDVNTMLSSDAVVVTGSSPAVKYGVITNDTKPVKSYICDATVSFDATAPTYKLTITYNGTNCALTRTRTGT